MTSQASRSRLSIGSPAHLAIVIPHILGFRPSESLVVVAARGPRQQLGMAMRVDLTEAWITAPQLMEQLIRDGAEQFVLGLFTDERPGPLAPGQRKVRLPHARLVSHVSGLGLPMMDGVLISGDRAWSYVCFESCCPPSGRPILDGPDVDRIKSTFLGVGMTVADSRDSLIAIVDPPRGRAADQAAEQLDAASNWVLALSPGIRRRWLSRAVDTGLEQCSDPRGVLAPGECAKILVLLGDIALRDYVLARLVADIGSTEDDSDFYDAWRSLLLQLLRNSVSVWDAPACTLFAVAAYHSGDGVLAAAALERALGCRPDYGLANLLADALESQLRPKKLMTALRESTRELLEGP